jgi:hypothetical protein
MKLKVTGIETIELKDPLGLGQSARLNLPPYLKTPPKRSPARMESRRPDRHSRDRAYRPDIIVEPHPWSTPLSPGLLQVMGIASSPIKAGDVVQVEINGTVIKGSGENYVMGLTDQFRNDLKAVLDVKNGNIAK